MEQIAADCLHEQLIASRLAARKWLDPSRQRRYASIILAAAGIFGG